MSVNASVNVSECEREHTCVTTAMPTSDIVPATLFSRESIATSSWREPLKAVPLSMPPCFVALSAAFSSASVFTCSA